MDKEQALDDVEAIVKDFEDSCCIDSGLDPCGADCLKSEGFQVVFPEICKRCDDCCGRCFKGEDTNDK